MDRVNCAMLMDHYILVTLWRIYNMVIVVYDTAVDWFWMNQCACGYSL
jgi:hypothetical protein